jgi:hypothetical protein
LENFIYKLEASLHYLDPIFESCTCSKKALVTFFWLIKRKDFGVSDRGVPLSDLCGNIVLNTLLLLFAFVG